MFNFIESRLSGCFEIQPRVFKDDRGTFVKTFHRPLFAELGLETDFPEMFYSVSRRNVIRGLHFQIPPDDHAKLVYCSSGRILDLVLDLRKGSPTYGQFTTFEIDAENGKMVYIPRGMAHGFLTVSERATVIYSVSSVHSALSDRGILWNSIGFKWPLSGQSIVSDRDSGFPKLVEFDSPFLWSQV